MKKAVEILKAISKLTTTSIIPKLSLNSPIGYTWQLANEILSCPPGNEFETLEVLSDNNYLERNFIDKLILCPHCNEVHVAFREVCSQCHSANIQLQDMIHHFRCGFVGKEEGFSRLGKIVCPKCDYPLRHIGVDYERPSQIQVCNSCNWSGSSPFTEGHCLSCGKNFDPDNAIERIIHSYTLTPQGLLAAENGSLSSINNNTEIIDIQYGTLKI